jgi:hypothetical protein
MTERWVEGSQAKKAFDARWSSSLLDDEASLNKQG